MNITETQPALCPVCSVRTLVHHCDSKTCNWHRCGNRDCQAVLDLGKRRGYAPEGNGFRRIILTT